MADAEHDLDSRLAAVAEQAVPAVALSPHVGEAELLQIRAGGAEPTLDSSYRHLASCASCRARLLELSREARAKPPTPGSVLPRRPRHSRPSARAAAWAAAAVTLLGLGYAITHRAHLPERLAIAQRPYAGLMGSSEANTPNENTNIELAFRAEADLAAVVVPWDETGKILSPPQWFVNESSGRAVVVLVPRTFLPHSGKVFGVVIWGSNETVREIAERMNALALISPPAASKRAVTTLVTEHGAHLQWLPLDLQ